MLTQIHITNCFSFVDAKAALSPFTLLIGANGAGKSNFLKVLRAFEGQRSYPTSF